MDTNNQFRLLLDELRKRANNRGRGLGKRDSATTDIELLEAFYFDAKVKPLTDNTLRCYAQRLRYLERYCRYIEKTLSTITKTDLQKYFFTLREATSGLSDETINGRVRVFKVFFNFLEREQLLDHNPMEGVKTRKPEKKVKPVLNPQQVEMILRCAGSGDFQSERNRALIMFMYDSACRVGEAISVKHEDLMLTDKLVKVSGAKTRRERFVPVSYRTAKAINNYQLRFRKNIRGPFLFCYANGDPITTERVYKLFRKLGEKANIRLYPHLLRHSACTQMLANGMSAHILQVILGHSSPVVTSNYIHLNNDQIRELHEKYAPLGN